MVVSMESIGLVVDLEAAVEAKAASAAAQALLRDMFPAVLAVVCSEDDAIRTAVIPFLQAYINKLKANLKRLSALPEVGISHLLC